MTHAEIKEGREVEIHEGDDGITIQGKKGGLIHKNASETDPALRIEHNGAEVVKRAREIEAVDSNGNEQVAEEDANGAEAESTEEPAEESPEDGPIDIVVEDEKVESGNDVSIEKEVETALEDADQDTEMTEPRKSGTEKVAGEKRDRDDLDDLEEASSGGEQMSEEDATSNGENGVKKQKKEHTNGNEEAPAVSSAEEVVQDAPHPKKIDENIAKVEAEESAAAGGAEEDVAAQA